MKQKLQTSARFSYVPGLLALALLSLPGTLSAAGPKAATVQVFSFSGVGVAGAACTDITCNLGDTCDCITGSVPKGKGAAIGTAMLSFELSVDTTIPLKDGSDGNSCDPATGNATLTFPDKSTANLLISGLVCLDTAGNRAFNGTLRLNGDMGRVKGALGSVQIGEIGGDTLEVVLSGDFVTCPRNTTLTSGRCVAP
jgi:hypothetical protein